MVTDDTPADDDFIGEFDQDQFTTPLPESLASGPHMIERAAGVVLIRWIGEPPKKIKRRSKSGEIYEEIDWKYEPMREAPISGHSVRQVDAKSFPGLSRTYHFGPAGPHLAEMTAADWEVLQTSGTGFKFADVSDDPEMSARPVRRLDDALDARAVRQLRRLGH